MSELGPREFALDVARRLQEAGYQALFAGGCVRDELLGRTPTDYDVATDARPDAIRRLFGHRRTIPVGAAFGVITVVGPKSAGNVEVATFRSDGPYSDGRHPDRVTFSDARHDAQRRDFTINGLFLDPIANQVLDYVGGQQDLQRQLIRAIGDANQRIAEDKLRMLRAVRFAAVFGYRLDAETASVIAQHAPEILQVSPERIADELRKMLAAPSRSTAVELLGRTNLLVAVLEEARELVGRQPAWTQTLDVLRRLTHGDFGLALAALIEPVTSDREIVQGVGRRWRLANQEIADVAHYLAALPVLLAADTRPWSQVQPLMADRRADRAIDLASAVAAVRHTSPGAIDVCRERLSWPRERLDPPPLVTGDDLRAAGLIPGPQFTSILRALRVAQLDDEITTRDEAIALAKRFG